MTTQRIAITEIPARVVGGFSPAAGIGAGWVDWHAGRRIGTPAWRDDLLDGSIPPPALER